ncbi:hypothetical protein [uncultured Draconibacterium sp.]|uniref:hypothetical protein n=1 Tax=uncultured Draconibacterium sp. TaxID=1573823 RepID=UPI0025FD7A9A|nr:hypothetical protein [uncultured Draconibacterium sp.]
MNILLIYPKKDEKPKGLSALFQKKLRPKHEDTKALIEISIQLPITWERKLLDLNHQKMDVKSIDWADYVLIRADLNQLRSTKQLIEKCKLAGKKIIAVGELFSMQPNDFEQVDHLILNEATFEPFVRDVEESQPKRIYDSLFSKEPFRKSAYSLLGFSAYFSRNIHPFSA